MAAPQQQLCTQGGTACSSSKLSLMFSTPSDAAVRWLHSVHFSTTPSSSLNWRTPNGQAYMQYWHPMHSSLLIITTLLFGSRYDAPVGHTLTQGRLSLLALHGHQYISMSGYARGPDGHRGSRTIRA